MQSTAAQAQATIRAFHARVHAAENQWHKTQAARNEQQFQDTYSPCNSLSCFHDLQCAHRIQTEYPENCSILCVHAIRGPPFLCSTCLIDVVRAEVALEELTLRLSDDDAMQGDGANREEKVRSFADRYVKEMMRKGYRACKAVSKLDGPRLQFFDQFMREGGYGGIEDEPRNEEGWKPHKRPGMTAGTRRNEKKMDSEGDGTLGKWGFRDPVRHAVSEGNAASCFSVANEGKIYGQEQQNGGGAMDGFPERLTNSQIELPPEDEASEAVRKALEMFALV